MGEKMKPRWKMVTTQEEQAGLKTGQRYYGIIKLKMEN